jgi:apolipoprotein N-acyltransferase
VISAQASDAAPGTRTGSVTAGLRTRWALLISLAGGTGLALAFPPFGIWPLAVVGPALLVIALAGRSLRGSFCCGLVFGLSYFVFLLTWLVNVAWYAWGTLAVALAVIFAVLAIGQRLLMHLRFWPVAVAAWWVTAEAVRDRWPWGFPWGRLAMSQAGAPDAGWMAIGGAPLLSFLLALTGAVLAWAVLTTAAPLKGSARRRYRIPVPAVVAVLTAGLVLAIALVPVDPTAGAPTAEVAGIQGNVPKARNLTQLLNDSEVTQNHAAETLRLAAQVKSGQRPAPDLVIWPENSTDLSPFEYQNIYDEIMTAVDAVGRPVLIGEVVDNPRQNIGQLWTPGKGPGLYYAKRQLVPFGEYEPLRGFISLFTNLTSLVPINFIPGTKPVVFPVGKISLGDVICYEVGFDDLVRSEVNAGANLLTVQSNDADFELDGQTGGTGQQVAMARLRAVESDRAVLYVSTTGESAIIEPGGQVIEHTGLWQAAIVEARVPLVSYRTLADRIGSWPEYLLVAFTVLSLLLALSLVTGIAPRSAGTMRWISVS